MSEERDRQAVLFTYAAGTTLTRAGTQTVKLGTFAPNIGIEGLSYDPLTGGFIFVKETQPQGIFQTSIDFAAGTATQRLADDGEPRQPVRPGAARPRRPRRRVRALEPADDQPARAPRTCWCSARSPARS